MHKSSDTVQVSGHLYSTCKRKGTKAEFVILAQPPPQELWLKGKGERDNCFGRSVSVWSIFPLHMPLPFQWNMVLPLQFKSNENISREPLRQHGLYPFRVGEVQGLMQDLYSQKPLGTNYSCLQCDQRSILSANCASTDGRDKDADKFPKYYIQSVARGKELLQSCLKSFTKEGYIARQWV